MTQYRVMVAGSRGFDDYTLLAASLDRLLVGRENVVIVSGGAKGADQLGEQYATERYHQVERHLPDWKRYRRGAGMMRNGRIADVSDLAVVFGTGRAGAQLTGSRRPRRRASRSRWCDSGRERAADERQLRAAVRLPRLFTVSPPLCLRGEAARTVACQTQAADPEVTANSLGDLT